MIPLYYPFLAMIAFFCAAFFIPLGDTFDAILRRLSLVMLAAFVCMVMWMLVAVYR